MWHEQDNSLVKEFNFPDFKTALAFTVKIGELAEAANHHPDVTLSWGKVQVKLTTHDAGEVTEKDKQLAAKIDQIKLQ
jgi:4a-hydroxytetrahydrobiopterin dehydratase